MMTFANKKILLTSVALLMPASAWAQQASPAPTTPTDQADSQLEDIVVTARKVAEPLQRTPVAVTAFTSASIERQVAFTLADLKGAPGVTLDTEGPFPTTGAFSIRGISLADKEPTFDPAVGVVENGVFLARNFGAVLSLYDVDSVEVLRGPQSTLFGRNTIGGVLNIKTHRPGADFAARGEVSYGNYNTFDFRGGVDVPIVGDRLGLTAAVYHRSSDGYFTNLNRSGPTYGDTDLWAGRLTLVAKPTDAVTLTVIGDGSRDRSGSAAANPYELPFQVLAQPAFRPLVPNDTALYGIAQEFPSRAYIDTRNISGTIDWDVGKVTLTSITAYRFAKSDINQDYDATPTLFFGTSEQTKQRQFSEEFRVAANDLGPISLLAGAYYLQTRVRNDRIDQIDLCMLQTSLGAPCIDFASGFPFPPGAVTIRDPGFYVQRESSWAIFGQAIYAITPELRLTAGGRYGEERKRFTIDPTDDNFYAGNATASSSHTWRNFSPKVGVDWQATPTVMLYASYTKGNRSGGYNGRAGSLSSFGPYDDEKVSAFDAGVKADLFNRHLRVNVAAFHNSYDNIQIQIFRAAPGGGEESIVDNAGSATMNGVEVETVWKPGAGFTVSGSAAYLDAHYDRFTADLSGSGTLTDNRGLKLVRAPEWTGYASVEKRIAVGDKSAIVLNGAANYTASYETNVQNFRFGRHPSVTLLDASVAWEITPRLRIAGWGKNLTNRQYVLNGQAIGNFFGVYYAGAPRTYGATVSFKY